MASVIEYSNTHRIPLNTSYLGLGASCQATLFDSLEVIRNANENHNTPFGDDKPQPLG